ncbi:MAG: hypothetical protein HYU73_22045 [Betaproteobacteria bacterium]|nr:hypothetical protein [Betaproteobacteria bacterium]MBI3055886.1 hypothetical protein [Betaproteobacteria bacterium]
MTMAIEGRLKAPSHVPACSNRCVPPLPRGTTAVAPSGPERRGSGFTKDAGVAMR